MTPEPPDAPSQELVSTICQALPPTPAEPRYNNHASVRQATGVKIAFAYQTGGVNAAAQVAHSSGYRAGQRSGQWEQSTWIRDSLNGKSRVPWTPEERWLTDTSIHAHTWTERADQENPTVNTARVPRSGRLERPEGTQGAPLHRGGPSTGTGLARAAALAYTLGFEQGQQDAIEATEASIHAYAYQRATELRVRHSYVDTALGKMPIQRPAPAAGPPHPAALAQSSFATPVTPGSVTEQAPTHSATAATTRASASHPHRRSR